MLEMFLLKSFKIEKKKVIYFHLVVMEENTSKMLSVSTWTKQIIWKF